MIRRRTRRGIILLALIVTLLTVLSRPGTEETAEPVSGLDTRLNYALHDFSGRLLDDTGAVRMEIEAPMLRNDASTGIGTMERPDIRLQQENDQWYITADSAVFSPDREQVQLEGVVRLKRTNPESDDVLDIRTRDVLLDVTPRTASSESTVHVLHGGDRIEARGLRLDMISDRIELLNEVRAHYEVL